MKRTVISAAVAAAFAGLSGQALALAPGAFDPATTLQINITGASAQRNQLLNAMRLICVAGTMDEYRQPNSSGGAEQFAWFCQRNTTVITGLTTANLAVYKSDFGGSGSGVQPVADNATALLLDMQVLENSLSTVTGLPTLCGASSVAGTGNTLGLISYSTRVCSSSTIAKPTMIGFSDVEPALFGASAAQQGRLNINATNALVFGVPVTTNLRNTLQVAQGLISGAEDEANMPSITKSQVAAIYSGQLADWSNFFGTTTGTALNNPTGDNQIYIARRVDSSGTQTSARVFFLNDPCAAGMDDFVTGNDTTVCGAGTVAVGGNVYEGSGSGDVTSCLSNHFDDGRWAIGVLSLEFSDTTTKYRFIKVDGDSPSLLNVVNGKYQYWMEPTMQWRKSPSPNPLANPELNFATQLRNKLQDVNVIRSINSGFAHGWGTSGLLALSSGLAAPSSPPYADADINTNPVNTHTKSPAGGAPVNCQPPLPVFSTEIGNN
ncbi:MAG: hypothetical protein ACKVP2_03490 [Burkholderiales bacterium]